MGAHDSTDHKVNVEEEDRKVPIDSPRSSNKRKSSVLTAAIAPLPNVAKKQGSQSITKERRAEIGTPHRRHSFQSRWIEDFPFVQRCQQYGPSDIAGVPCCVDKQLLRCSCQPSGFKKEMDSKVLDNKTTLDGKVDVNIFDEGDAVLRVSGASLHIVRQDLRVREHKDKGMCCICLKRIHNRDWPCQDCEIRTCEGCAITWWSYAGQCPKCGQNRFGIHNRMNCRSCSHPTLFGLYVTLYMPDLSGFLSEDTANWRNDTGVRAQKSRLTWTVKSSQDTEERLRKFGHVTAKYHCWSWPRYCLLFEPNLPSDVQEFCRKSNEVLTPPRTVLTKMPLRPFWEI